MPGLFAAAAGGSLLSAHVSTIVELYRIRAQAKTLLTKCTVGYTSRVFQVSDITIHTHVGVAVFRRKNELPGKLQQRLRLCFPIISRGNTVF